MADVKISALPAAASVATADEIAIVHSGVTDRATIAHLRDALMPVDLAAADVTGVLPKANQGAQDMAGDVTGTTAASVVSKVKGTTITTAGGALAVGAVLRTTAVGTADWGAVDLADTDAVTGVLPSGNAPSHSGDVTGAHSATVVEKINGATVPAAGSLTTDHVLKVSGVSATSYGYVANANVDAAAAIAGTKIDPDFGAQLVKTTGDLRVGSTYTTAGSSFINAAASGSVCFGVNGATKYEVCSATSTIQSSYPLIGSNGTSFTDASPYGVHGKVKVTLTGDYTLTASEFAMDTIELNGSLAASPTITLPSAATDAKAYKKRFKPNWTNTSTATAATLTTGAGNTYSLTLAGGVKTIEVNADGVEIS